MITESQAVALFAFFEKYASALHTMAQDEKEKLNALLSNSLPRIEHAISTAQANTKLIENLEIKRLAMQDRLGCGQLTFSQLLDEIPDSNKPQLSAMFKQIQAAVNQIKFTNDKSMAVANTNMTQLNPGASIPKPGADSEPTTANRYNTLHHYQSADSPSILKVKV